MGQHVTLRIQVFAGSLFPFRPNPIRIDEKKKCDSHCWHSHCCRTFFAPMSHRTAGIRTFDIRTLVSFALLTPSHCWHSHCWLRTGVVRTSVFRTLVVQAKVMKTRNDYEIACDCVKRANVVLHVGLWKEIFARKHTATHKPTSAQPLYSYQRDIHLTRSLIAVSPQASYDRRRHRNCFPTQPAQAFPKK